MKYEPSHPTSAKSDEPFQIGDHAMSSVFGNPGKIISVWDDNYYRIMPDEPRIGWKDKEGGDPGYLCSASECVLVTDALIYDAKWYIEDAERDIQRAAAALENAYDYWVDKVGRLNRAIKEFDELKEEINA